MEKNLFNQPIKSYIKTYENIRNITIGQGDDCTTNCLLDYNYFKSHKMIAIDFSKQQSLHADPKAIQEINVTRNLNGANNRIMFLITEELKRTISDFLQRTVKVLRYKN